MLRTSFSQDCVGIRRQVYLMKMLLARLMHNGVLL